MNYLKAINIIIVIFIFSPSISQHIPQLKVGHDDIDISFIKPYSYEFQFSLITKDGKLIPEGRWTDHVDFIENDEKKYIRRKVVRFSKLGIEELSRNMIGDAKTLAPSSSHQVMGENIDVITVFHYDNEKVSATLINSSSFEIKKINVTLDQSPFDLSFWSTLALGIPFEIGYKASLPAFKPGSDTVSWENFTVLENETIRVGNNEYETYVVESSPSDWKFWLRKEYPYIVKIEHPFGKTRAVSFLTQ